MNGLAPYVEGPPKTPHTTTNNPGDEFDHGGYGVTGDDKVYTSEYIEQTGPNGLVPKRELEAPELIRHLSFEERARLEKKLVRKIDLRLLPMIVIMLVAGRGTARVESLTDL